MWDTITSISRGRVSLRRFSLLASPLLMALFLVAVTPVHVALAADAVRSGGTVTYADRTYTLINKSAVPAQLPMAFSSYDGYVSFDSASKKAYYLLTTGAAATASSAIYTAFDMPVMGSYGNNSPPATVSIVNDATASTAAATKANTQTSCDSSQTAGIGWIVCPVVSFLAKGMDYIYKIVSDFLVVKTITTDTSSSIYRMWSIIRDIANICFVGAFLVIIYSQITGLGYSNYNLKKMLPRLIIGAILVNISYWVTASAVDISNIIGYSINDIFSTVLNNLNSTGTYEDVSIPEWEALATVVLAGGGALVFGASTLTTYGITGSLFLLIPSLLGVILAALVALIVLAARQALIICLIIISPLAFVAMLLPNTEKYFNKWRELLTTMLLLFPIFAVVFSGAQLAGLAIVQSAGGNIVTLILGMVVQVAPIVITPLLIKFSGGLIGRIAGMVNNPNKGLIDRTRNWGKANAEERRNKILADQQHRLFRRNPLNRATKRIDTRRRNREARRKAYESLAEARFEGTRQGHDIEALNKHAGNEKQHHQNAFLASQRGSALELRSRDLGAAKSEIENTMMASPAGQRVEARTRNAAVHKQEIGNTFDATGAGQAIRARQRNADIDKVVTENSFNRSRPDLEFRAQNAEIDKMRVTNEFEDSRFGHQVDRAKRQVEEVKTRIHKDHQTEWDELSRTDSVIRNLRLRTVRSTDTSKLKEEEFNTVVANIRALGGSAPDISAADKMVADSILQISRDTRNEAEKQSNAKIEQDKGYLEALSGDEALRLAVGGIRGDEGSKTVFAKTVAASRKEYIDRINETSQLVKHFNPDSATKQRVAMGESVTLEKDGVRYTFDASDSTAREAFIDDQLKAGSGAQIQDIIDSSGTGGVNYEYRTSIRDAVISNGLANRFFFWGAKTLDDIGQGKYSKSEEAAAITYHVRDGKLRGETLTSQDAYAIDALFNVINDTAAMSAMSPTQKAAFDKSYQDLKYEAWRVIHDPQLSAHTSGATKDRLKLYMEKPPKRKSDRS